MKNNDFVYSNFAEFKDYICASWKNLNKEKQLCDVTLACDDKLIETHKIIISSFSPVFRNILRHASDKHPVIYLRGVSNKDIEYLLNFMYCGEVNIAKEDLNNFISVAQDLKIQGLHIDNEKWNKEDSEQNNAHYDKSSIEIKTKSGEIEDGHKLFVSQTNYSINNFLSPKIVEKNDNSEKNTSNKKSKVIDHIIDVIKDDTQNIEDNNLTKYIEIQTENESEKWNQEGSEKNIKFELDCDGIAKGNAVFNNHVNDNIENLLSENIGEKIGILNNKMNDLTKLSDENAPKLTEKKLRKLIDRNSTAHPRKKLNRSCVKDQFFPVTHENSKYRKLKKDSVEFTKKQKLSCKKCEKQFESNRSIRRHHEIVHEGIRYRCDECDYEAREIPKLRMHIESVHRGIRFHCNKCDFVSATKSYLKMHMDSLHEGKRFPCKKCNYQSTSKRMLVRHVKKYFHE